MERQTKEGAVYSAMKCHSTGTKIVQDGGWGLMESTHMEAMTWETWLSVRHSGHSTVIIDVIIIWPLTYFLFFFFFLIIFSVYLELVAVVSNCTD